MKKQKTRPDPAITQDLTPLLDKEGYLKELTGWSEELAVALAEKDGVVLTEQHWEIIRFLRDYYQEYQVVPAMRVFTRVLARQLGKEKSDTIYLYTLFPDGPVKQASKYAGLPKPTSCI